MKTAPRKTVNIVALCEGWLTTAKADLDHLTKEFAAREAELNEVKEAQAKRVKEIVGRQNQLLLTISAVISAGGDASSLEKKKFGIESELAAERADTATSKKIEALELKLDDLNKNIVSAQSLADGKTAALEAANRLSSSFELDNDYGAKEAPEYETLEEVIRDYVAHVRFDFCVSGIQVEQVAIWGVPDAKMPLIADMRANKEAKYLIKALPDQLNWLAEFDAYKSTPRSREANFKAGLSLFVHSKKSGLATARTEDANASPRPAWVPQFSHEPSSSVYCSMNYKSGYRRSGLCYVRQTDKFYSLWPEKFPCADMKPKKETRREGYYDRESVVEYPELTPYDASALLNDLASQVLPAIQTSADEMGSLLSAKTALSLRIRETIDGIADTNELFAERSVRLNADEIHAEIGAYWDAFVNAPWEPSIHGACGMLKHLCERRIETPHVYSYPVKGHYGLRVRTRDHDWIYAELFCPPSSLSPKDPVSPGTVKYLAEHNGRCDSRVMVGPCCMYIYKVD